MGVRVTGLDAVRRKVKASPAVALAEAAKVITRHAESVATDAKELVPVDDGVLKGSIRAAKPTIRGWRVTSNVSAGGPSAPYALVQHEDTTLRHTVGQAKYIEQPWNADMDSLERDMETVRGIT